MMTLCRFGYLIAQLLKPSPFIHESDIKRSRARNISEISYEKEKNAGY